MWKWLSEKAQMPRFVWLGVLAIMLAIAWQIATARNLFIDLHDRTLKVAHAERAVAEKEKAVYKAADETIDHLETLKRDARPEMKRKYSAAQMSIRDKVKKPMLERKIPD
jgi:hypothetical protein